MIEIVHLTKRFGDTLAVDDLTLHVEVDGGSQNHSRVPLRNIE